MSLLPAPTARQPALLPSVMVATEIGAKPSQIEEIIYPMDTEVMVEVASCPGALPSAWMWHADMQQSLPWLPQTMQVQPVSAAVQEGYSWFPYAGIPQAEQTSKVPEQPHHWQCPLMALSRIAFGRTPSTACLRRHHSKVALLQLSAGRKQRMELRAVLHFLHCQHAFRSALLT